MRCFYSPYFDINLPQGHTFSPARFRLAQEKLLANHIIRPEEIVEVDLAEDETIDLIHTPEYREKILSSTLTPIEKQRLGFNYTPDLFAHCASIVEATRMTCRAALEEGVSVCLGGGMHQAHQSFGDTFSVFNDVAIAVKDILRDNPSLKILVIDTDALKGTALHVLLGNTPQVFIYDLYTGFGLGGQTSEDKYWFKNIVDISLSPFVKNDIYLTTLYSTLADTLENYAPDLIIWVSGCNQMNDDQLGHMNLSPQDLMHRDQIILSALIKNHIPCAVLYGGGYNKDLSLTAQMHYHTVATAKKMAQKYLYL